MAESRLFQPVRIGDTQLSTRIALAPLTRYRASDEHVPLQPMVSKYYAQRGSTAGTLLITEATFISPRGVGYFNAPGLWHQDQLESWKKVTAAVHEQGSFIFAQLWHMGRACGAGPAAKHGADVVSASDIPLSGKDAVKPRPLTEEEIQQTIADYAQAARNAVEIAGFDGVEIHGANGYLIDQFLQESSNKRTDGWGGSVEKRSRFALEVARAVAAAVGPGRTGIRLSPWSHFQGMGEGDSVAQFSHVVRGLKEVGLAYLHLVEPRIDGGSDRAAAEGNSHHSNDYLLDIWDNSSPVLLAGGFKEDNWRRYTEDRYKDKDIIITFGRPFIANPDLVYRLRNGLSFNAYDRKGFYTVGSPIGYIDNPFSDEWKTEHPQSELARL